MSEEPEERKLSISTTQVVASALAAMSVAFMTSWLGTAGTIIGACLGSVIATVGTAAYSWSLRRTSTVVKQTAAQVRQTALLTNTLPRTVAQGPLRKRSGQRGETPAPDSVAGEAADETSVLTPAEQAAAEAEVDPDAPTGRWDGFPWKKTMLATGAVLLLCIGGITVLEVVTGQSMASISGHDDSKGTTVGNVVQNNKKQDKTPAPSNEQTRTPDPGGEQTQAPSVKDTAPPSTEPTPSTEPSPSTVPNDVPSSGASAKP
jgi:hypothetical protein